MPNKKMCKWTFFEYDHSFKEFVYDTSCDRRYDFPLSLMEINDAVIRNFLITEFLFNSCDSKIL